MYSIQEMESKRYDHINYRLEFIKTITERGQIDNLTIQEDRNDKDIRKCLNKKVLDFNNLISVIKYCIICEKNIIFNIKSDKIHRVFYG